MLWRTDGGVDSAAAMCGVVGASVRCRVGVTSDTLGAVADASDIAGVGDISIVVSSVGSV